MEPAVRVASSEGRPGRVFILLAALMISAALIVLLGLKSGYPSMSWAELHSVLLLQGGNDLQQISVLEIRLPRIVLGLLAGCMLGLAGVLLQDSLKNPLAGPELLGVSAGASCVMAAVTVLPLPLAFAWHPVAALIGGLFGGAIVLASAAGRHGGVNFILIGAAVTAILNGLIIWIVTLGSKNDIGLLYMYLFGSLAGRNWSHVDMLLPWAIAGIAGSLCFIRPLNVLKIGEEAAEGLGMRVTRMRILMLTVCCGMVAAVVAQCGPIAYIALISPHLVRYMLRTANAAYVLPCSAAAGAVLLTTADFLGRTVLMPREVPVGLWTTLIGAPILITVMMRNRRRGIG